MRRNALIGLLFTAAVALFIVPVIAPPKVAKSPAAPPPGIVARQAPNERFGRALSVQEETAAKHDTVRRDMAATENLCRLDCSRDMKKFIEEHGSLRPEARATHLRQVVKEHPHMVYVSWTRDGTTVKEGAPAGDLMKLADGKWRQAQQKIKAGEAYQSPSFEYNGKTHFVLAQPGAKKGDGVVSLVCTDVVQEVQRHQRRNLRLVPYPAEGRYRLESVVPNTNRDTTVRSGEDNGNASHYAVDELVVKFRKTLTARELLALRKELGLTVVRHRRETYLFRSNKYDMDELKRRFAKWHPVFMEPHYLYLTNDRSAAPTPAPYRAKTSGAVNTGAEVVPNDTLYKQYQWNLPEIATEQGWKVTRGKDDMIVAIVDTGVQSDHPDLKGRLVPGRNIIDPSQPPNDDVGHGTHVAGIIAAQVNNNEGVAGMTWYTKIMPVKALDSSGAGTTYSVAEGIIWATDHGADVINMSLGNYADAQFLHDAVKYAHDHGVVLIAASGNDNTDRPGFPAAYPEVFAVSATNEDESKAEYSNYGDYIDVAAPGTSIASTYPGSRYAALSGTSMASPHVAALASLVRAANPNLSNEQVMELLRKTAKDLGAKGKDIDFGYGQIDVNAAVEAAGNAAGAESAAAGTGDGAEAIPPASEAMTLGERLRREIASLFGGLK